MNEEPLAVRERVKKANHETTEMREALEGDVTSGSTEDFAYRMGQVAIAFQKWTENFNRGMNRALAQAASLPAPIVIEGVLESYEKQTVDFIEEWYELDDQVTSPIQDALVSIGKGKRIRVTIEVLENE